jgi:hypothetical protein
LEINSLNAFKSYDKIIQYWVKMSLASGNICENVLGEDTGYGKKEYI